MEQKSKVWLGDVCLEPVFVLNTLFQYELHPQLTIPRTCKSAVALYAVASDILPFNCCFDVALWSTLLLSGTPQYALWLPNIVWTGKPRKLQTELILKQYAQNKKCKLLFKVQVLLLFYIITLHKYLNLKSLHYFMEISPSKAASVPSGPIRGPSLCSLLRLYHLHPVVLACPAAAGWWGMPTVAPRRMPWPLQRMRTEKHHAEKSHSHAPTVSLAEHAPWACQPLWAQRPRTAWGTHAASLSAPPPTNTTGHSVDTVTFYLLLII